MTLDPVISDFLARAGWPDPAIVPITPDWSPRHFWRLARADGARAVLIHAPMAVPGHSLDDFARLAQVLRGGGLSAPAIFAQEPGLLLVEDFGDTPIDTPAIEGEGYATAIDALAVLRVLPTDGLVAYRDGYIYKKLALFSDDPAWLAAWEAAKAALPPCPSVFAHMDYKAGNLHWLAARADVARVGILDFQAAQCAPFTYDVVNLLEDARRNLDPAFKAQMKQRFYDALPDDWKPLFDAWYVFMAAQFHARVLGQVRGQANAAPDIVPRLEHYLAAELRHGALAPIRPFFDALLRG
ncbi:MAG: phosphotransferase [Rhodospirillales bacterium]|nr:phosphotransferase [Alphaproteobacteria bacterium]MCB9986059.1 phosphotransferase [Rhodospirillales bacterium]USO07372.1 MAG: phosphotransferase [Rhodospirillales bacterium]